MVGTDTVPTLVVTICVGNVYYMGESKLGGSWRFQVLHWDLLYFGDDFFMFFKVKSYHFRWGEIFLEVVDLLHFGD